MENRENGSDVASLMQRILYEVKKVVVGQDHFLERVLVAILAQGHLLVEGVPGPREDAHRQDAREGDSRLVPAHPVHARPRAGRPRRHAHLQPEDRRFLDVARAGVHQPAARRRNQPRAGQGAKRAARGDAGIPGDDRRPDALRADAVPGHGDAEPDRDRGHVPAARSAGRPLHDEGAGRLSERGGGVRDRRARHRPCGRRVDGRDHRPARGAPAPVPQAATSTRR